MTGWTAIPLGDICRPRQWRILSKSEMVETGFPVYGANGVIGFAREFTHEEPVVLVGCRGTIGAIHITKPRSFATGNAMALDALNTSLVDQHYLARYLSWRGVADVISGSSQPQLTRQNLLRLTVPSPPLVEQRRIAAILDKADEIRVKRREALTQLDTLPQSLFRSTFGNRNWPVRALGELSKTTSGGTPDRSVASNYGGDIPWVKSGELHGGVVTSTEETITRKALETSSAKLMPPGTVLMAMYGATAGVVAELGVQAATNQAVCSITPGEDVDRSFLITALRSRSAELLAKRSGGAQPNLSQAVVRTLKLEVPPLALQREFAAKAAAIETQRAAVERALAADDELFASLQSRAFRGEL